MLLFACSKEAPVPEPETVSPPVHTLVAGFETADPGTRSRLSFGDGAAKVLWTAGDSFKMIRMTEGGYTSATYSTQDDGTETATFTSSKTLADSDTYTSGYPADIYRVGRKGETGCYLITPVPSEQEAVPGGIAEGLNRAAAISDRQDADLHFHNMLSIIRFRLEGASVGNLASVTLHAGTTVAGEATVYFEDGNPVIDFSKKWSNETIARSSSISLSGTFEPGKDYCMALVPVSMPAGFDLVFRDKGGNELFRHSSKALTLTRSRITDFGTIRLPDNWNGDDPALVEYMKQTKGNRKNVIAVLAEGYTESELDLFEQRAKRGMDFLFSVEPYRSYKDYFTVYLFRVASNESGAGVTDGDGNLIEERDTYFKASWAADSYSDMKADVSRIQAYLKVHIPEVRSGNLTYQDVPVILLINDTRYGGICHIYSQGWSYAMVPYQHDGRTMRWAFPTYQPVNDRDDSEGYRLTTAEELDELGRNTGDWRYSLLHEFGGHGYGRLSDEYWGSTTKYTEPGAIVGHSYEVPLGLNVSGFYDKVPWQEDLLDHLDEWIARNPDYSRIGIWHGALTSLYYRWRSEKVSCMMDNRAYFSSWQRILIVRKILSKAGETFDMQSFIEKDVTLDPIRPAGESLDGPAVRRARSQAMMAPEMPMLPPPVIHEEEE